MSTACGTFRPARYAYIDPAFDTYVQTFESISNKQVHAIMIFADIADEEVGGTCTNSEPPLIVIDTPYWNEITELGREQLVLHELGHCVLNRDHKENMLSGLPVSIMYSIHFGDEWYYAQNRAYYLQELVYGH